MALVAAAATSALSAHAFIITAAGDTNAVGTITSTDYKYSNLAGITSAGYSYSILFYGNGDFAATFTDGGNELDVTGTGGNVSSASNTYSYSGIWTSTANTNLPVARTGTYSGTFDLNSQRYNFSVAGAPVPEPASLGVLGVGAVALIRRRKRA